MRNVPEPIGDGPAPITKKSNDYAALAGGSASTE
jgi:hypothetical protein